MQPKPVDVISICSSSGEIRPLRLRVEDEEKMKHRIDIDEVISTKPVLYAGTEAQIFLCRATVEDREWVFELKYTYRSHSWCIWRRIS